MSDYDPPFRPTDPGDQESADGAADDIFVPAYTAPEAAPTTAHPPLDHEPGTDVDEGASGRHAAPLPDVDGEPSPAYGAPPAPTTDAPSTATEPLPRTRPRQGKKPGPKPMTDAPTVRFEGQMYPEQLITANAIVTRLKMENSAIPAGDRRRLTVNSLVRIGMTLVSENANLLHGNTEDALLESLREALNSRKGTPNE